MGKRNWVTKEQLQEELQNKTEIEQRKIMKRVLQENGFIFKNNIKCKVQIPERIEIDKVMQLKDELLNQKSKEPVLPEEYEFLKKIKTQFENREERVLAKDLLEAIYYAIHPNTYKEQQSFLITESSFWLRENIFNVICAYETLNSDDQERIRKYLNALKNGRLIKGIDSFLELLKNGSRETGKVLKYMNRTISPLEISKLCQLLEEREKNKELIYIMMGYVLAEEISINENKGIFGLVIHLLDKRLTKLQSEFLVNKSKWEKDQRIVKEIVSKITKMTAGLEETKFITFSNETMDNTSLEVLKEIMDVTMDYNTFVYLNIQKKENSVNQKLLDFTMSEQEVATRANIRNFYKNGEIIKIPPNMELFTKWLEEAKMSKDEIKYILTQMNLYLHEEKEEEYLEIEEPQTNEVVENKLVYLKSDLGNVYALKDIEEIPIAYYETILELLESIQNNSFKNVSKFTRNNFWVGGMLEVKGFKIRVIFQKLAEDKYAILGIFMKKTTKNSVQQNFLSIRANQFLKQQKELAEIENESEITEVIKSILQQEKRNSSSKLEKKLTNK